MNNITITTFLILVAAFVASWLGVGLFRRWSLQRELLDVPNERSSHTTPTPRGGGLVIALVGLLGYVAIHLLFAVPFSKGYFFGALMIAVVSWLDDLYSIPFWARLAVHVGAAVALVADLGAWNDAILLFPAVEIHLGAIIGGAIAVGWIVWLVNAYNFMDGIDGIAALQAAVTSIGWIVVGISLDATGFALFAGVVACVSVGFLVHNWQPAKIFMGDVGSAFFGFTLAAMPLLVRAERRDELAALPVVAILFVWFFVFDTIFTLLRRVINRERVWEAHRGHLYQKMVIGGMSHQTVSLIYGSAAALIVASACLALVFAGSFGVLTLSLVVILTSAQLYLGFRKKR